MAKLRKMLGSADAPYILSLMKLIETQSKATIARWCIDYTREFILPIYTKECPGDAGPLLALDAADEWLQGNGSLKDVKKLIQNANTAAKDAEDKPAAQAAARCLAQAAASIHTSTHSLGLAFYGAAAIAYDREGIKADAGVYDRIACEECGKMEAALRAVAVENEPDPAKINWYC